MWLASFFVKPQIDVVNVVAPTPGFGDFQRLGSVALLSKVHFSCTFSLIIQQW
jgi:hypothetical protein